MRSAARAIARLEPKFDAILTSPRASGPADRRTGRPGSSLRDVLIESDALSPQADPKAILLEIEKRRFGRVLVVGHMPHLGGCSGTC